MYEAGGNLRKESTMTKAESVKVYLRERYGIRSEKELKAQLEKMKPINIGVFVAPLKGVGK